MQNTYNKIKNLLNVIKYLFELHWKKHTLNLTLRFDVTNNFVFVFKTTYY